MNASRASDAERGTTLIELAVVVALLAIACGVGYATLAQRPAQARTTAIAFAALVAQARARAAVNEVAGGGTSIAITSTGGQTIATLYLGRPIRGNAQAPIVAPNVPPLRTTTIVTLTSGGNAVGPPFTLFFSASGHASAAAPYALDSDAPLALEPVCPAKTGIIIGFRDGVDDQTHAISCELARLDLDAGAQAP